jgi:hypothetical protein
MSNGKSAFDRVCTNFGQVARYYCQQGYFEAKHSPILGSKVLTGHKTGVNFALKTPIFGEIRALLGHLCGGRKYYSLTATASGYTMAGLQNG